MFVTAAEDLMSQAGREIPFYEITTGRAVRAIYRALSRSLRRMLLLTILLMIAGTAAELVSIGAVLPFLAVLTSPELVENLPLVGPATRGNKLSLPWSAAILVAAITTATVIRLVMTWASQRLSFGIARDVSIEMLRKVAYQPYSYHIRQNSAELMARFEMVHALAYSIFASAVQASISTFVAVFIVIFLMFVDPVISIGAAAVLLGFYIVVSLGIRSSLATNSAIISSRWSLRAKKITETLHGIRDVLLDASQTPIISDFSSTENELRRAQATNALLSAAPRVVIEAAAMILLILLSLFLSARTGGIMASLPVLGALALGAQRLLPLLQSAYNGWSQLVSGGQTIRDVAQLLLLPEWKQPPSTEPMPFTKSIAFDRVFFAYSGSDPTLSNVSLTIAKGERIGIVGATGSGKSTLTDLLMGLLTPTSGVIAVDGVPLTPENLRAWHQQIAHVPQSIYLVDDTVAANIALGLRHGAIDMDKVRRAAKVAGLAEFIEQLPDGYKTMCGERGVRFSGGQRQRIGIARALYKDARLLILDEATSALDLATEGEVIKAIKQLDPEMTIVIVAHRASTLAVCTRLFRVSKGGVTEIGPKEDLTAILQAS